MQNQPGSDSSPDMADGYAPRLASPVHEAGDEFVPVHREVGDTLEMLLPWGISVLTHMGLVIVAIFLVWMSFTPPDPRIVVPDSDLSYTPGVPLDVAEPDTKRQTRESPSRSISDLISKALATQTTLTTSAGGVPTESMGISGLPGGAAGQTAGRSPFGQGVRNPGDFRTQFFGVGGNARTIIYCIDASGSLIDTLPFVVAELKRSIGRLNEQQQFNVVFFHGTEAVEIRQPKPGMKKATYASKQAVFAALDPREGQIVPGGATNPVAAIEVALRQQPDLVYLLSDNITGHGRFAVDQRHLLQAIAATNQARTRINTIQFVYPDPMASYGYKPTMMQIAEQHGGRYKFVDARELGIAAPPAQFR